MNDDHIFRLILIVGFVAVLPVGISHRLKAATFEKLDRRQEGLFLLISIRLLGLVQLAIILTFLIDPFGDDYRRYRERTRRFFPRLGARK